MLPIENEGDVAQSYVYDGGTWTWIARNQHCLWTSQKQPVAQTGWWKQRSPRAQGFQWSRGQYEGRRHTTRVYTSGKRRKLAEQTVTHTEVYVEFDGYEVRIHRFTNRPSVLFPEGPLCGDRARECTSGIKRKFEGF